MDQFAGCICMAPAAAASEEEHGMEVDIVPAAPDPQQHSSASQEEEEVAAAAKIKEALSEVETLRASISQLLGTAAGPHRAGTGDAGRRCLVFMETELSIIAAFLTTLSPQHLDAETKMWLNECTWFFHENAVLRVDRPSRQLHTLLPRAAAKCFRQRNPRGYSVQMIQEIYSLNQYPCIYRHLLPPSSGPGTITPQLAETGALPLVGIDRPVKKILRWLTHQGKMDSRSLRVLSIVGPVGIGKTTLAVELRNRLIRQHGNSGGHCYFQCNAMSQASRGTDRNIRLLQDILSQVSPAATSDPSQAKTMDVLVRLVSERLRDKRYFIIIDDIHEASDWEEIKGAFPSTNNPGSRILITTRITSIAEACCSGSYDGLVHKMKPLNKADSETLLLAKIAGSLDSCPREIVKLYCVVTLRSCDGIPLFITVMADWLIKELLEQQEQQHFFEIETVPHELPERLEQSLSTAFNNDFPNNELWLLMLYMSMFPYGYKFDKDRLIWKWALEGLISWPVSWSKAETLFFQLVDRNVIKCVAANCNHDLDDAEACQWHVNHFVHQFLVSKSAEIGFVFSTATLSRIPRRLALHHPHGLRQLLHNNMMDLSQTRSLAVSRADIIIHLEMFANLVVLDLQDCQVLGDEELRDLCTGKMLFLWYLSVRNTPVSKVPHEIKELRSLQTLDVSYTQISELPLEVFELTAMEHLDLRGTQISQVPKQIMGLRSRLLHLLVGGSAATVTRMPHDLCRLDCLSTLATVDLTEQPSSFIWALGKLRSLRVLAVTWSSQRSSDRDCCEAFLSSIGNWSWLESLTIHGLGCSMEFLGSLERSRAPRGLEKFKVIAGRFASVPPWIDGHNRLAFVQITFCNKQATVDLKILGDLPKLQCLILGLDFIPAQAIVIENEGFRMLQRLSFGCVVPWLTFQTGAMPRLTHLQLKFSSSPAIEGRVPSGITKLPRISEVVLSYSKWCANSTSVKMTVKAVREQVANHCNPIDLSINGVEDDAFQAADEEAAENATGTSNTADVGPGRDSAQAADEDATTGVIQIEVIEADSLSKATLI